VEIKDKVAVVTGAASGIGYAVCLQLARRGAKTVAMVDLTESLNEAAEKVNQEANREVAVPYVGDVTDVAFRKSVYQELRDKHGTVNICVPAAGITRDNLSLRINKETGKADIYPIETFRTVIEVNLIAPTYWALEMVGILAEERKRQNLGRWKPDEGIQGTVVFIGSVSSQGNKGQISYASTKAGLEGAAATLMKEAIFFGVRCGVIHPGFTDTPMVRALGEDYIEKHILPDTQLGRLIRPEEIADAICFMITNAAISGEIWADAGWHPAA
jgi:NAD(P)-dependent dehydrogenase (short-subunit alcohol dehydrogenase family)